MFLTVALIVVRVVLFVAPLLLGQCGPNGCSVPQRGIRASYQPVYMPQGVTYQQPMPGVICGPNGCQIIQSNQSACGVNGCVGACPGGCSCANCPQQSSAWINTGPGTWEVRSGGRVVKTWNEQTRELRSEAAGDVMTDPKPEAKPVAAAPSVESSAVPPTGVDWSKVADYKGHRKSREQLYQELGIEAAGNDIPRDATKPMCALVSSDPNERKQFESLWETAPELAPFKERIRCKLHSPDDPVLKDRDGTPTPYAQPGFYAVSADGTLFEKVELTQASPATMAEALYKVDPSFKPGGNAPTTDADDYTWLIGLVVAVGVVGFMGFAVLGLAGACFMFLTPGEPENATCPCE